MMTKRKPTSRSKQEYSEQVVAYTDASPADKTSPTLLLMVFVACLGALTYLLFITSPANAGDMLPYTIVLFSETFLIILALTAIWTILSGDLNPRNYGYHNAQDLLLVLDDMPVGWSSVSGLARSEQARVQLWLDQPVRVDVFITVFGEDPQVVLRTATAAKQIIGAHRTILLDDGESMVIKEMADSLGIEYYARREHDHAKAGNINAGLRHFDNDFFVIFDADFAPTPNFLYETLPFFEDSKVAFVQTPQAYRNEKNIISRGAGYMQSLFYKLIMPGKNHFNSAFCVGTNVIFRRTAIDDIGGIYEKSKSEDIWTSLLLHERGWRSVYLPDVLAVGDTPDTIESYSKQQLRWATGGLEIFLLRNPLFNRRLTVDQKIQYFVTGGYYLHGLAILGLLVLPVLHIFFNVSPVDISTGLATWALVYFGFYGLQVLLAFYAMRGFRFETMLLAMVSFPIYIKALFHVLFGLDKAWNVTGRKDKHTSPFNYIIPQLLIYWFLLFTTVVALYKAYYYETVSLSLVWVIINAFIFGRFIRIARMESRRLKKARRQTAKKKVHHNIPVKLMELGDTK